MTVRWLHVLEPTLPKADIKDLKLAAFEGLMKEDLISA
jgi:hypothetical protein